jgi:hypothetical protein
LDGGSIGSLNCSAADCTYTPPSGYLGVDTFTYTIDDAHGGQDTATVTVTVVQNTVTVTSAIYRTQRERWQIAGTVSPSTSSVEVFLNVIDNDAILIGAANVNNNDGTWNFNGTSGQVAVAVDGDSVFAVSSSGAVSDPPFLVDVRR